MPRLEGRVSHRTTYPVSDLLVSSFLVFPAEWRQFRCVVTGCERVWRGSGEYKPSIVVLESAVADPVGYACTEHTEAILGREGA